MNNEISSIVKNQTWEFMGLVIGAKGWSEMNFQDKIE